LTPRGRRQITTPAGAFEDDLPVAYRDSQGERSNIPPAYVLDGSTASSEGGARPFRFELGEYDPIPTLVPDPAVFFYRGYIGGTGYGDVGWDVPVDSAGNAYVVGRSIDPPDFPVVGPAYAQRQLRYLCGEDRPRGDRIRLLRVYRRRG
jgi:hypothetical protein